MKSYVEETHAERVQVNRQPGQVGPLWEAWELAQEDAGDACRCWWSADREHRADAYCAYVAAADREAAAAAFLNRYLAGSAGGGSR